MPSPLQPFLISEFKTGLDTYLEPWIRPKDSFEPLVNAYIYRGTVNKRSGYTQYGNTLDDNQPVMGIMRYINETTGVVSLLVASTQHLYLYQAGPNTFLNIFAGFTGNITNFFNYTNWQVLVGADSIIYMTNNKDPVTTYNGTVVAQPTFTISAPAAPVTTIKTCLDLKVYKERLLFIRPTLQGAQNGVENQTIIWSAKFNPLDTDTITAGHGGSLTAPTGDIIQSAEFLRDVLVVNFTNSTWIFRFTGSQSDPFRWDKINNTKSINAPYGSESYDERTTSLGNTGFIACDGANVQRYDISIIDYYETEMSVKYFAQAFSQRYDNLNQAWLLYVSQSNSFPAVGNVAPGSDKALIYNFLENTFCTYTWSIPLTCLGLFYSQKGTTWADLTQKWEDTPKPWNYYGSQKLMPILLSGDTTGHVWEMDDGSAVLDAGFSGVTPITFSIIPDIVTTRWNPVMQAGQKVQFAYIDIYYGRASTDVADPIQLTLNFYIDNSEGIALSKTLTLDAPSNSQFAFKRIYMNLVGQFMQMEVDPDVDDFFQLLGFILWVRPAGRLTP